MPLIRAPDFWQRDGTFARLLAPASLAYAAATAARARRPGWRAPVPVICCGGVTAGGAGKTPLALDLGARLLRRGRRVAFLTRGYGRASRELARVDPATQDSMAVGDEPLLLAALAPTIVCADRAAAARAAIEDGADLLVMDDGLQNPGLHKDMSLLVIDGLGGIGNGRVIPAGPLREPVTAAAARCRAAVLIGEAAGRAPGGLPPDLPILRARLVADPAMPLRGVRVLAFAGIARPAKFFATLREAGADVAGARGFADHHRFSARDLDLLLREARAVGAAPITTAKDAVRLPASIRDSVLVLRVSLQWDDTEKIERLLDEVA